MMHRMAQGNALALDILTTAHDLDQSILTIARQMVVRMSSASAVHCQPMKSVLFINISSPPALWWKSVAIR